MPMHILRSFIGALVLAAAASSWTPTALARPATGNRKGQMRKGNDGQGKWMAALNLTDAQKTKMKELRKRNKDSVKALRDAMHAKHEALKALLVGDASIDKIRAAHSDVQDTRRKLDDLQFDAMLEIRTLMTPEQRKQFGNAMEQGPGGPDGPSGPNVDDNSAPE